MSSQNTPITATQFAPDSTAASDPSNSATAGGRYQPSLDSPGPSASLCGYIYATDLFCVTALYYGAVALAVFACVLLAAATRFVRSRCQIKLYRTWHRFYLLRKKDRRRTAQRLESERSDLERRGEVRLPSLYLDRSDLVAGRRVTYLHSIYDTTRLRGNTTRTNAFLQFT